MGETVSKNVEMRSEAPKRTKLGLLLWLVYINNLIIDSAAIIKYADDIIRDTTATRSNPTNVTTMAIAQAKDWFFAINHAFSM